jgi:hypothetical protein
LAKWFQRKRFKKKSANQKQESPVATMCANKIAHFVPILLQTWPLQAILVSDWTI